MCVSPEAHDAFGAFLYIYIRNIDVQLWHAWGGVCALPAVYDIDDCNVCKAVVRDVYTRDSRFARLFLANKGPEFSSSRSRGLLCFSKALQR